MPRPPSDPPAAHGIALPAFAALPPSLGVAVRASERSGEAAIYSASLGRPGQLRTSAVLAVAARVPKTRKPKARRLSAVLAFAALPPSMGVAVSASERRGEAAIYSRLGSPRLASRRRGGSRPSWPSPHFPRPGGRSERERTKRGSRDLFAARFPKTRKPKARSERERTKRGSRDLLAARVPKIDRRSDRT